MIIVINIIWRNSSDQSNEEGRGPRGEINRERLIVEEENIECHADCVVEQFFILR